MTDRVAVEVTVAAPADAVWRALRDPAEIRRWLGWEYDLLGPEIEEICLSESASALADGPAEAPARVGLGDVAVAVASVTPRAWPLARSSPARCGFAASTSSASPSTTGATACSSSAMRRGALRWC